MRKPILPLLAAAFLFALPASAANTPSKDSSKAMPPRQPAPAARARAAPGPTTKPASSAPAARTVQPSAPAADDDGDARPSVEEIRALFDEGKYPETLRLLGRVLPLKGRSANGYDRYELLTLKGETHLRMGSNSQAVAAFADAVEEAEEQGDRAKAAVAQATLALLKRAKGTDYIPRSGKAKGKPLDILDPAQRKPALEALYADERAAADGKIGAGLKARTLPPIATALEAAKALGMYELAATGENADTDATLAKLADRGKELMTKELERIEDRVDRIGAEANKTKRVIRYIPLPGGGHTTQQVTYRQGLSPQQLRELRDIVKLLPAFATNAKGLAAASGGDDAEADEVVSRADDVLEKAKEVLNEDYTQ